MHAYGTYGYKPQSCATLLICEKLYNIFLSNLLSTQILWVFYLKLLLHLVTVSMMSYHFVSPFCINKKVFDGLITGYIY